MLAETTSTVSHIRSETSYIRIQRRTAHVERSAPIAAPLALTLGQKKPKNPRTHTQAQIENFTSQ